MPNHYVSDYEAVTGQKIPADADVSAKVITTEQDEPKPKKSASAKTKG